MDPAPNSSPASALLTAADTTSAVHPSAPPSSASRMIAPDASMTALACGPVVTPRQIMPPVPPPNPARSFAASSWSAVVL